MDVYMSKEEARKAILELVPKTCPACGAPLELSKNLMHLKCTNSECTGKLYRRIEIMAKAFGIENIGIVVANELVQATGINSLVELFDLSVEDIAKVERFGEGMATKLYNSIHAVQDVQWSDFIRGIQIPRVGAGTSKEMAEAYKTLDELLNTDKATMAKRLPRVTVESTGPIVEAINRQKIEILALAERVNIVYSKPVEVKSDLNLIAVVTGKLNSGSRPDFQKKYGAAYGIKWASAVSTNTDILVTNEASNSSKYQDAKAIQEKGGKVRIMTEQEFLEFIGGSSVTENFLENTAKDVDTSSLFGSMGATL